MKTCSKLLIAAVVLLMTGCAGLPENTSREASFALQDTEDTTIGRASAHHEKKHPGKSGFILLDNGLDAFVARAVVAEVAERSLDLQYYLYHNDLVGSLLAYSLLRAADRGVRVRILLDDMGLAGRDINISMIASHPNIQIRIFNPFSREYFRVIQFLTRFGDVTRRMHNKSFTVDNTLTIVGGRNIGNEYFNADPEMAFGDLDVIAIGNVVEKVSESFDEYWNSPLSYPIETLRGVATSQKELDHIRPKWQEYVENQKHTEYYQALVNSDFAKRLRDREDLPYVWGEARVMYDKPEKITSDTTDREYHLAPQLTPDFGSLEKELVILAAYFVPGKEGVEYLKSLREKGIRVRILTNSIGSTDVSLVHAGYSKYRKSLLRAGVELYEVKKGLSSGKYGRKKGFLKTSKASLHAKAFILDREKIFIGSLNFDPRSFDQNTEIGIIFKSPELAASMVNNFDSGVKTDTYRVELKYDEDLGYDSLRWSTLENGERVEYTWEPDMSFWQKILLDFAMFLPIESQL